MQNNIKILRKKKRLILYTLMVDFSGILDIGQVVATEYYLENRGVLLEKQILSTKTCQKKKKKQKQNVEEIDTETSKKKQGKILIFCIV